MPVRLQPALSDLRFMFMAGRCSTTLSSRQILTTSPWVSRCRSAGEAPGASVRDAECCPACPFMVCGHCSDQFLSIRRHLDVRNNCCCCCCLTCLCLSGAPSDVNEWHHWVVTYNSGNLERRIFRSETSKLRSSPDGPTPAATVSSNFLESVAQCWAQVKCGYILLEDLCCATSRPVFCFIPLLPVPNRVLLCCCTVAACLTQRRFWILHWQVSVLFWHFQLLSRQRGRRCFPPRA